MSSSRVLAIAVVVLAGRSSPPTNGQMLEKNTSSARLPRAKTPTCGGGQRFPKVKQHRADSRKSKYLSPRSSMVQGSSRSSNRQLVVFRCVAHCSSYPVLT